MPPANAPIAKTCVVCGQDVTGRQRTKDKAGRYYCTPCYEQAVAAQQQAAASIQDALAFFGSIIFCEICGRQGQPERLTKKDDRVICFDCLEKHNLHIEIPSAHNSYPDTELNEYVRKTNWLLIGTVFAGIFLPPFGIVLQIISMQRLLKLANRPNQPVWIACAALPLLGLIFVKLMADRAGRVVHKPINQIRPLDRIQQRDYRRLLALQFAGAVLVGIPWIASKIASGFFFENSFWLALFLAMAAVGMATSGYAIIHGRPYRKVLREAAGPRILFSDSSDVVGDWTRQQLVSNSVAGGRA